MYTIQVDNTFLERLKFGLRRYLGIIQTRYRLNPTVAQPIIATLKKIENSLSGETVIDSLSFSKNDFEVITEAIKVSHQFSRDPAEKEDMKNLLQSLIELA